MHLVLVFLVIDILFSSDATSLRKYQKFPLNSTIKQSFPALASYIKLCKQNDRACYIQHGNDALPHLINGDKDLNLPELNPLKLERIEANAGDLRLNFKNIDVYGLDTLKLLDME